MHRVLTVDILEDGTVVPVAPEDVDWSEPPDCLNRAMRRRFKRLFDYYQSEYRMPEDMAHYRAMQRVIRESR